MSNNAINIFYDAAKEYLTFIENEITYSSIEELIVLLMRLYISGHKLPELEPETTDAASADCKIHIRFEERMPMFYKMFDNPFKDKRPGYGFLVDDLQDIANDLIKGIEELISGNTGNAVFEWKQGFYTHWGEHAVNAIRALHSLIID